MIGFCCCGLVGAIFSILVLTQAGGVNAQLAQYGNPPDLVGKVNTGKICAIIGLVLSIINALTNSTYIAMQSQ